MPLPMNFYLWKLSKTPMKSKCITYPPLQNISDPDLMEPNLRTQYRIKTENVSYRLFRWADELRWGSLRQSEREPQEGRGCVLRGVSCEARPGEITSIAGPSGAGKTTLLEILAGMVPMSRVSGRVLVNDKPMNVCRFRRVSGYVTQEEALFPFLTVEETLLYSARLRLGGGLPTARARVRALLTELGLDHIARVRIGGESSRGISGGEKRRVSIGVDLVHDPSVLLMDEPTSGLDSASALHIALLLKSMAVKQNKTIVLTIHQPGFRILELFDKILLLSNGSVLHFGSIALLEQRLALSGHSIPKHVNVLEFAIEMTTLSSPTDPQQQHENDNNLNLNVINTEPDDAELISINHNKPNIAQKDKVSYTNNQFKEIAILTKRFSINICRTKQLFAARTIQALVAGIVLGTIFMNTRNHKLQTQMGFFAFTLSFLLSSTTEGLPIFLQERAILTRETSRGAYRVSSYVISNALVFLPFLLVVSLLYATPVYWLVGLRRDLDGFLYFLLVVWLVLLMANSLVMCFSALVPNFIMGTSLIAGVIGSFFLFSGYFITKEDIPRYWMFMHYLSLFKYPFECLVVNEFGGRCVESLGGECFLRGEEFLVQQGLREGLKWSNVGVMLGFVAGYRLLGFLILWCRTYRTRN